MAVTIEDLHQDHKRHKIVTYAILLFIILLTVSIIFLAKSIENRQTEPAEAKERLASIIQRLRKIPTRMPKSLITPSITPMATPSISKQPLIISTQARLYSIYKTHLKANDLVAAILIRSSETEAINANDPGSKQAVDDLNAISPQSGLKKMIVFSSVDDVKRLIGLVPKDVLCIAYDYEPVMTPQAELNDPVGAVTKFADIVHAAGMKMAFIPTYGQWDNYEKNNQLKTILGKVDAIDFQGQRLVTNQGVDALKTMVSQKYKLFKSIKPELQFMVQMWCPMNTTDQIVSAFKAIEGSYDVAGVYNTTSNVDCQKTINNSLIGLGR
jgi:hypothetical protein